ncbi:MAG: DUF447 family protein [Nitrospinae bacterium]|nr:DUF447 family protein [Nitrospinota bacterium]
MTEGSEGAERVVELIAATVGEGGRANFAPMGARFLPGGRVALIAYHGSSTHRNLAARGGGALNLTRDALLFVKTALFDYAPPHTFESGAPVMDEADEARVFAVDRREELEGKTRFEGQVVARRVMRVPESGFNRAAAAVMEALIAATRIGVMDADEIGQTLRRCAVIVSKTGGGREREAMRLVEEYVRNHSAR